MNAAQRRECILTRLSGAQNPVSASALAAEQSPARSWWGRGTAACRRGADRRDAAGLPAASGRERLYRHPGLRAPHRGRNAPELYTIVDQGGVAVDVAVENSLYGEIRANLNLASRYDVDTFLVQARSAPESAGAG